MNYLWIGYIWEIHGIDNHGTGRIDNPDIGIQINRQSMKLGIGIFHGNLIVVQITGIGFGNGGCFPVILLCGSLGFMIQRQGRRNGRNGNKAEATENNIR